MIDRLPCYKSADCCPDEDCDWLGDNEDEPCWGQTTVTDEWWYDDENGSDSGWIHACEGHSECYEGKSYIRKEK